jgi:hypothetical protein
MVKVLPFPWVLRTLMVPPIRSIRRFDIAKPNPVPPKKKVILIGDSTQSDPEAYGECARIFPGWVGAIFIRKVTGIAGMDEGAKNGEERFAKAFEGVEKGIWHTFTDPKEVGEEVEKLVGGG